MGLPGSPAIAAARLPIGPMKRQCNCAKGFVVFSSAAWPYDCVTNAGTNASKKADVNVVRRQGRRSVRARKDKSGLTIGVVDMLAAAGEMSRLRKNEQRGRPPQAAAPLNDKLG